MILLISKIPITGTKRDSFPLGSCNTSLSYCLSALRLLINRKGCEPFSCFLFLLHQLSTSDHCSGQSIGAILVLFSIMFSWVTVSIWFIGCHAIARVRAMNSWNASRITELMAKQCECCAYLYLVVIHDDQDWACRCSKWNSDLFDQKN